MLDGLKHMFNIGGTSIAVSTGGGEFSQGGVVSGEVVVVSPEHQQTGRGIELELKEFWTEQRGSGKHRRTVTVYKTHDEVMLAKGFDLGPMVEYNFPFQVRLPINCRLSTRSTGWILKVTMDVPNAVDPSQQVILKVQPAREFMAIIEICARDMQLEEKQGSCRWSPNNSRTYFRLSPSPDLKGKLDFIAFELVQTGDGGVQGQIIFDRQEKSLGDYFRAAVGKDDIKRPIQFSASQLLSDGHANSLSIRSVVGPLLQEVASTIRG